MQVVPVTLLFSDGVARRLDIACGTKLVDAAAQADLHLLTDCSNGQCGTCTAQLCSGSVDLGDYDPAVLPDEDRDSGVILPCVSKVQGPCVIEFPYDSSEASAEEPPPIAGTIVAIEAIATETVRLEIQVAQPLDFEPGQYVRLRPAGSEDWRSYSMANCSGSTRLVFYIRTVAGGVFSQWLSQHAKPGSEVELSVPHGSFFLRNEERPRLFVAGGTGLAPFLSMLEAIHASADQQRQPTTLLMGVRTPAHLFALDDLARIDSLIPNLQVRFAAESDADDSCQSGYATDLITSLGLDPSTRVYLCGPPPMVDAGRNAAVAAGMARHDVLCERFA